MELYSKVKTVVVKSMRTALEVKTITKVSVLFSSSLVLINQEKSYHIEKSIIICRLTIINDELKMILLIAERICNISAASFTSLIAKYFLKVRISLNFRYCKKRDMSRNFEFLSTSGQCKHNEITLNNLQSQLLTLKNNANEYNLKIHYIHSISNLSFCRTGLYFLKKKSTRRMNKVHWKTKNQSISFLFSIKHGKELIDYLWDSTKIRINN
ncbi:hypothetical protein RFI_32316 [Reticulomyxa filosa]|uniref:Uncharacterized protein n=1 Tax=Reticulomyxa filosa TaxID=46433 RepID=X6LWH7_RETFI|nr:hypothetical protein RFI_32316 [Reticulomyxa filosa]|eukprot:ETO05080.1 hypothetical protein RFI_32316 [Reticulomyxa filosa]